MNRLKANLYKSRVERIFSGANGLPQLIDSLSAGEKGGQWREANDLANQLYSVLMSMAEEEGQDA